MLPFFGFTVMGSMVYLRALFLVGFTLFMNDVNGAQQTVLIAKEQLGDNQKPTDLAFLIFDNVLSELKQDYDFKFVVASAERMWLLLKQADNACAFNKMKTIERAEMAYFSAMPVISFPPNRLISRISLGQASTQSLSQLAKNARELVGVVDGRMYGPAADAIINTKPENFYIGKGNDKAARLRNMLIQGKLDVILEYAMTFESFLPETEDMSRFFIYRVEELSNEYVDGFIACSKSAVGARLIKQIDEVMASEAFMIKAKSLIHQHVPKIESENIILRIFEKK
ncbi:hypothetical protein DRW07_07785 [Alteromonas sediminis]|uniref:Solute-binding protein family 3/N-terminal domain-containing protein n=1 Tax=Alteromonas sediminis TaxID=2259342 RepID=A0A3N5YD63_9ALTE|nr:hypothetical protein [Alteromonas sediminis]RPJ67415.1 hypothetical protein DRW07_07785 [Alteromonas sediminis]